MEFESVLTPDRIPHSEIVKNVPKIGLVGLPGSGKGLCGEILSLKKGYTHLKSYQEILLQAELVGLSEPKRRDMLQVGYSLQGMSDFLGSDFLQLTPESFIQRMQRKCFLRITILDSCQEGLS